MTTENNAAVNEYDASLAELKKTLEGAQDGNVFFDSIDSEPEMAGSEPVDAQVNKEKEVSDKKEGESANPSKKQPTEEADKSEATVGDESKSEDDKSDTSEDIFDSEGNKLGPFTKDEVKNLKAQEKSREAKAWKKIQEEKEQIKAEREQIKKFMEEQTRALRELKEAQERKAMEEEAQYNPEDVEEFAKKMEKEGNEERAKVAYEYAQQLRAKQTKLQRFRAEQSQKQFLEQKKQWVEKAYQEHPELQDVNNEFTKDVIGLIQKMPALRNLPDGEYYATKFVAAQNGQKKLSSEVSELKSKIEALTNENAKLKKNIIPVGGTSKQIQAKVSSEEADFDKMSQAQKNAVFGRVLGLN